VSDFSSDVLDPAALAATASICSWRTEVRSLKLRSPMVLPFGTVATRPSAWLSVRVDVTGTEATGWGEGATLDEPLFTDDSGGSVGDAVNHLLETLAMLDPVPLGTQLRLVQEHRFYGDHRYPTARVTVEMALLDATARALGTTVAALTGLPDSITTVPVGSSIGGGTHDAVVANARRSIGAGSSKLKLKVTPTSASAVVAAIDTLRCDHADLAIMVDANGTFDPHDEDHLAALAELDQRGLLLIEEPVSRVGPSRGLDAYRVLRRRLSLRSTLCADDCAVDADTTRTALSEGLVEAVNLKPGRIGSLLACIDLARDLARDGHRAFAGGMLEATPGRCMTAVLAAHLCSLGFDIPGDTSLPQDRLEEDLVPTTSFLHLDAQGDLVLPTGLGWGFDVR
jgi:L-alanine-DL-glutamate epimerase-like enolase superfamily enzyme